MRVYPSYFRSLYQEAEAGDLGLAYADFCCGLERIACHLGASSRGVEFYRTLHLRDLALVLACRNGSDAAWEQFERRYRSRLQSAAMLIARNDASARELADSLYGELFLSRASAGGKLASYSGRGSLEGWLKAVLAQSYINRCRSERKSVSLSVSFDEQIPAIREACMREACKKDGCEPALSDSRLDEAVRQAFLGLPPEGRYLLVSHFLDQRTLAEIGRTLGVHESTVCRRLNRLVRLLRARIARRLREKGMSARQVEEAFQADVRQISFELGGEFAGR